MTGSMVQSIFVTLARRLRVPENILVKVGGAFLYFCRVSSDSPTFSGSNIARIGLLFLIPVESDGKSVSIKLLALRLGSSQDGVKFVPDTMEWEGVGSLSIADGRLEIEYLLFDKEIKIAEETVWPEGETGNWEGVFTARNSKGEAISGRVRHVSWSNASELQPQLSGLSFRYRDLLSHEEVGKWGKRLYDQLSDDEKATAQEPNVLIDVVSGNFVRATNEDLHHAFLKLREINPHFVAFQAEYIPPPKLTIGVGPLQ